MRYRRLLIRELKIKQEAMRMTISKASHLYRLLMCNRLSFLTPTTKNYTFKYRFSYQFFFKRIFKTYCFF